MKRRLEGWLIYSEVLAVVCLVLAVIDFAIGKWVSGTINAACLLINLTVVVAHLRSMRSLP